MPVKDSETVRSNANCRISNRCLSCSKFLSILKIFLMLWYNRNPVLFNRFIPPSEYSIISLGASEWVGSSFTRSQPVEVPHQRPSGLACSPGALPSSRRHIKHMKEEPPESHSFASITAVRIYHHTWRYFLWCSVLKLSENATDSFVFVLFDLLFKLLLD